MNLKISKMMGLILPCLIIPSQQILILLSQWNHSIEWRTTIVKGSYKDYKFLKTFPSFIAANEAIANREIEEQLWVRGQTYTTKSEGDKIYFTCRGYPRCPKRMLLHLDPTSQDVHVSVSLDEHSHALLGRRPRLDPRSRARVLELIDNGLVKPRSILRVLEDLRLPVVSRVQINSTTVAEGLD